MSALWRSEKFKLLQVVGHGTAQVVEERNVALQNPAVKVDRIDVRLEDVEDRLFPNKIVKQGNIVKQIFYVDTADFVRHQQVTIPFMVAIDVPGVDPEMDLEIQNHVVAIDVDFSLASPTVLVEKVVIDLAVTAAKWVEKRLPVFTGKVLSATTIPGITRNLKC